GGGRDPRRPLRRHRGELLVGGLETCGVPVAAPVRAADERVADAEDRLADAEAIGLRHEERLVSEPPELVGPVPQARLERDLASRLDAKARSVERLLRGGSFQ